MKRTLQQQRQALPSSEKNASSVSINDIYQIHKDEFHGYVPEAFSIRNTKSLESLVGLSEISYFTNLIVLDIQGNSIKSLEGLSYCCKTLRTINATQNHINQLPQLATFTNLEHLFLAQNHIRHWDALENVVECLALKHLTLQGNTVTATPGLRQYIIGKMPSLMALDDLIVTDTERLHYSNCESTLTSSMRIQIPFSFKSLWVIDDHQRRLLNKIIEHSPVIRCQRYIRGFIKRKWYKSYVASCHTSSIQIQRRLRGFLTRRRLTIQIASPIVLEQKTLIIQKWIRNILSRIKTKSLVLQSSLCNHIIFRASDTLEVTNVVEKLSNNKNDIRRRIVGTGILASQKDGKLIFSSKKLPRFVEMRQQCLQKRILFTKEALHETSDRRLVRRLGKNLKNLNERLVHSIYTKRTNDRAPLLRHSKIKCRGYFPSAAERQCCVSAQNLKSKGIMLWMYVPLNLQSHLSVIRTMQQDSSHILLLTDCEIQKELAAIAIQSLARRYFVRKSALFLNLRAMATQVRSARAIQRKFRFHIGLKRRLNFIKILQSLKAELVTGILYIEESLYRFFVNTEIYKEKAAIPPFNIQYSKSSKDFLCIDIQGGSRDILPNWILPRQSLFRHALPEIETSATELSKLLTSGVSASKIAKDTTAAEEVKLCRDIVYPFTTWGHCQYRKLKKEVASTAKPRRFEKSWIRLVFSSPEEALVRKLLLYSLTRNTHMDLKLYSIFDLCNGGVDSSKTLKNSNELSSYFESKAVVNTSISNAQAEKISRFDTNVTNKMDRELLTNTVDSQRDNAMVSRYIEVQTARKHASSCPVRPASPFASSESPQAERRRESALAMRNVEKVFSNSQDTKRKIQNTQLLRHRASSAANALALEKSFDASNKAAEAEAMKIELQKNLHENYVKHQLKLQDRKKAVVTEKINRKKKNVLRNFASSFGQQASRLARQNATQQAAKQRREAKLGPRSSKQSRRDETELKRRTVQHAIAMKQHGRQRYQQDYCVALAQKKAGESTRVEEIRQHKVKSIEIRKAVQDIQGENDLFNPNDASTKCFNQEKQLQLSRVHGAVMNNLKHKSEMLSAIESRLPTRPS